MLVGMKRNAVFGFLINFDLRMIRPHVALAAVLRIAGLLDGKFVPRVACRTGPLGTVRVNAPDAGIRPGGGSRSPLPMTLTSSHDTASSHSRPPLKPLPGTRGHHLAVSFHDFRQTVIQRPQNTRPFRMM